MRKSGMQTNLCFIDGAKIRASPLKLVLHKRCECKSSGFSSLFFIEGANIRVLPSEPGSS